MTVAGYELRKARISKPQRFRQWDNQTHGDTAPHLRDIRSGDPVLSRARMEGSGSLRENHSRPAKLQSRAGCESH
jgi:hypothetical protein